LNFLGLEDAYSNYENARTIIVPIPYEQTTSYMTGAKNGPQAIIDASAYVELYDEELNSEVYRTGIHTLPQIAISGQVKADFQNISNNITKFLKDDKFAVSLGGEHSITFPIVWSFDRHFDDLSILQLDAHSDLRASYEDSIYSHAAVMRRVYEVNRNIVQVGIRSQCIEEAQFIRERNTHTHYAHQIRQKGFTQEMIEPLTENVYITIDMDFFDPSVMPATGTPEPGGFFLG